jgi:cobalt-zinc-cadmium resistance protein CzcA
MQRSASAIAAVLGEVPGAADVKVEQPEGLPMTNVTINRAAIARYGLSVADVQDVVAAAIGGREAGQVFEGDRRFDLDVRLAESMRADPEALANMPIPLQHTHGGDGEQFASASEVGGADFDPPGYVPLEAVASIETVEGPNQISRENGKRRIVVQANVRGRDIGSFVAEAQSRIAGGVKLSSGSWLGWGGQFENLVAARKRLAVVVPLCFCLFFVLLFTTFGSE